MTAGVLGHHGLLVLGVACLGGASVRVASRVVGCGLERVLVAFTFACAAAACESLGLGLVALGGSSLALGVAALATWAGAVVFVERPAVPVHRELVGWLAGAGDAPGSVATTRGRSVAVVGGAAGLAVTWIAWQLHRPLVGGDPLIYHLPIASAWVQNGRPGSIVNIIDGLAVANYPVTNEVLVSWGLGLSRSWVIGSVWSVVVLVVLAGGSWATLRTLEVPLRERVLAVLGLCTLPLLIAQLSGPDTDIAALAWLAVTAALATAALGGAAGDRPVRIDAATDGRGTVDPAGNRPDTVDPAGNRPDTIDSAGNRPGLIGPAVSRPALICPAVIAAGLCVGTKTTPAILILGLAVVARRPAAAAFRDHRAWFAGSLVVAIAVGGIWSLRDLIVHGSPFWPLEASPWGTPVQASLVPLEPSFLSDPRGLIANHGSAYLRTMAGGLVLILGGLGAAVVSRSRSAVTVAGLAGVAVLAWGVSPYTGIESGDFAAGATRYLLPALAAGALALVLSLRGAGRAVRLAIDAVMLGSIAYSVTETAQLGDQFVPRPLTLAGGLLAGVGLGCLMRRAASGRLTGAIGRADSGGLVGLVGGATSGRLAGRRALAPAVAVLLAAGSAFGLAVASDGYVARHARTGEIDGPVLEAGLPGLGAGSRPVAAGPATVVMLRGDHLDHPLSVIGANETCADLRARLGKETIVLQGEPVTPLFTRLSACLADVRPEFADPYVHVYV